MNTKWEEYRKIIKSKEIAVIVFAVLTMIFGIICDCLVSRGYVFLEVDKLNEASLTLLQIQASITTLTLTIIALLSGNISDSYMGISISSYYLEIRPVILKQRRIIVVEFIILAVGVLSHLLGCFNIVISGFFVSIVIIMVAIFEIYAIFKGRKNSEDEILMYVDSLIDKNDGLLEIGKSFLYDWKKIVANQSTEDFELYSKTFLTIIEEILFKHKKVGEIKELAESIVLFLLTNESDNCKLKGINLVNDFYESIWLWIYNNQDLAQEIDESVSLISFIDREWYCAINTIGGERLEREEFRFGRLAECVIRVASWIGYSDDSKSYEVASINRLASSLGWFIDKENKKGNIVNLKYWESIVTDPYGYPSFNVPKESEIFYKDSLAIRDFNVIRGFLLSDQLEYVKDGFFLDGIDQTYRVEDESFAFKTMLIHCFMFYLAFRESNDCIEKNSQDNIKKTLTDKGVIKAINNFYYRLSENVTILSENLENKIRSTLQHYELFPIHSNSKSMIIDGVIRDYYLYVVLLLSRHAFNKELVGKLLDVREYHTMLMDSKMEELKNRFSDLHKVFTTKELSEEEELRKTDEMLFDFTSNMKEKYKIFLIDEAKKHQEEFLFNNIQEKTIAKIKEVIDEKFHKVFGNFSKQCNTLKTYERVHIFSVLDYTEAIGEDYRGEQSDYALARFDNWLMHELSLNYGVKTIKRNDEFETDEEFREFLKSNNYNTLLGSQYPFGTTDYMKYKEHNEFLANMDCHFNVGGNDGIALRKDTLFIKINDVIVDISSPSIEDFGLEMSEVNNVYKYSPIYGIELEFEKDVLQKYLYDERKVIDVYLNVTVGFSDDEEDAVIIERTFDD